MNLGFLAVLAKENPVQRRIQKRGTSPNKNCSGVIYWKVVLLLTHRNWQISFWVYRTCFTSVLVKLVIFQCKSRLGWLKMSKYQPFRTRLESKLQIIFMISYYSQITRKYSHQLTITLSSTLCIITLYFIDIIQGRAWRFEPLNIENSWTC